MRVQLKEKVSLAARVLTIRQSLAARGPAQCTSEPSRARPVDGAGGRRARGEADGQQMGCYGGRACPGDGLRGPATAVGYEV